MPHLPYDVYALHELNTEVGVLTTRNEQIEIRIGAAGTPIEQFYLSARDIDEIILTEIDKINTIKKEIIKISADAFNAVAGINSIGSDWYLAEISDSPSSYNNYNFILTGTAQTGQSYRGAVGVNTEGVYINILSPISKAPVYPDRLRAWQFPELEDGYGSSGNAGTANLNPVYPGEYQTITDQLNNAGIGKTSNLFFNGEYNGVFSAVPMGYFYDIVGVSTIPVYERTDDSNALVDEFAGKISTLEAQIADIRTYITEAANGATAVKEQKHERQLTKWGLEWSYDENERRIAMDNDAIEVIEAKEE